MLRPLASLLALALMAGSSFAQSLTTGPSSPGISPRTELGDSPLTTLGVWSGSVDAVVVHIQQPDNGTSAGTFVVSGIPAGATILGAWMEHHGFGAGAGSQASLLFDGTAIGPQSAEVEDPAYDLLMQYFHFDVSGLVSGDGSYPFLTTSPATRIFADALFVVYEHPSLPSRTVYLQGGAENIDNSTSTSTFDNVPAGPARLLTITHADNVGGVESLDFNGTTILGPGDIFDGDGVFSRMIDMAVSTISGTNSLSLSTSGDWFGYGNAILIVEGCAATTQEYGVGHPGTLGVPGIGMTPPVIGQSATLSVSNSWGSDTIGTLIIGFAPAEIPLNFGGSILVDPWRFQFVQVPFVGYFQDWNLPNDPNLCGISFYTQMLEGDPGASKGISATAGLRAVIGDI